VGKGTPAVLGESAGVPGRDHRRAALERPGDGQVGIVPADDPFVRRRIDSAALVLHVGGLAQDVEAVGEAGRNPELAVVAVGEGHGGPVPVGGGAPTEVHRHVEDLAAGAADQLALRLLHLIVQPPQHAGSRSRVIVLDEFCRQPRVRELTPLEALSKKPALVAVDTELYQDQAVDRQPFDTLHRGLRKS